MTPRTIADRSRRDTARARAVAVENAIRDAVRAEYPDLRHWALQVPHARIVRTGAGEDDWRWGAYRSAAAHARAYERYCDRAIAVAAARISEAYGLGVGSDWAQRHFSAPGDERQALAGHVGA